MCTPYFHHPQINDDAANLHETNSLGGNKMSIFLMIAEEGRQWKLGHTICIHDIIYRVFMCVYKYRYTVFLYTHKHTYTHKIAIHPQKIFLKKSLTTVLK